MKLQASADESTSSKRLHILCIVAGTNEPSNSATLAAAFIRGLEAAVPADVSSVALKHQTITHFSVACYGPDAPQDDFQTIEELLRGVDGVVIASPVWNFGVPAHFTNLIDRMGAFGLDRTKSLGTLGGKPFFLIFTAGMPRAATIILRRTLSHVWYALQYFGGSVLGIDIEGSCTPGRGQFGLVVDKRPKTLERMEKKGAIFARQVERFARDGSLPIRYVLIKKFVRFAQLMKKKLGL